MGSSHSSLPVWTDEQISQFPSIGELASSVRGQGCGRCDLGKQEDLHGPVIFRGNPSSRYMLIGEGPGANEDLKGEPFVGDAGKVLNRIFQSVGLDTNDWYIGNTTKCRAIAPPGSGKMNLTPTKAQADACRPFISREIELLNPDITVLAGKTAAESILRVPVKMSDTVGTWMNGNVIVVYHPAALLHADKYPEKLQPLRQAMWKHARMIRNKVDELEGRTPYYNIQI